MIDFRPIILAGGSGTRFWPRSRRSAAKQVLALDGERSMIQQTMDRLIPLAGQEKMWVITNDLLAGTITQQLDVLPRERVICEPAARNTAPAAGLAAFLLEKIAPESVLGIFPADHVVGQEAAFVKTLRAAIALAVEDENMVVLGIQPTHAETGYGYIETGEQLRDGIMHVRRFTEKPNRERAEEFVAAGNYFWNSGIFVWQAKTLANAVREHLPEMAPLLEEIAAAYGTPQFAEVFARVYPQCENISVDYAILEPRSAKGGQRSKLYCIPAEFGWNDLGSWSALYEHKLEQGLGDENENVLDTPNPILMEAQGNYVYSPGKMVALVGVENLVVVETGDALLVTTRQHAQDVGKVVKELARQGREHLI
jgi:mannose-1-phosphate guanylyltransferase